MSFENLLQFILSATGIGFAARFLVKASDDIAKITGLGQLFVGSLFLAASTSSPELFVDIEATRKGIPDLAAGDLLGSSLVNLSIFCAINLIFCKSTLCELPRQTRLASWLAALLTAEVGLFIFFRPQVNLLGFSLSSMMILLTYFIGLRVIFEKPQMQNIAESQEKKRSRLLFKPIMRFFSGSILIFFASPYLISSVEKIADQSGLGKTFIGASVLALATSFPELASSITAIRRGLFQLAAGNIVGSNAINMLIFVAMSGTWTEGSLWSHLSRKNLISASFVIINMVILALPSHTKSGSCLIGGRIRLWTILFLSVTSYIILFFLRELP